MRREGWGDESLGQQMYYGHCLCEDCLDSDPDELMMADKADPGIKKRKGAGKLRFVAERKIPM